MLQILVCSASVLNMPGDIHWRRKTENKTYRSTVRHIENKTYRLSVKTHLYSLSKSALPQPTLKLQGAQGIAKSWWEIQSSCQGCM